MKIIFLIMIGLSVAYADFTRDNGIVTDSIKGLVWQDKKTSEKKTWEDAIKYCERFSLNGYYDWRLPNVNELNSIIDYSRKNIIKDFSSGRLEDNTLNIVKEFNNAKPNHYWSSTVVKDNKVYVWTINFQRGELDKTKKITTYSNGDVHDWEHYVRCVADVK